MRLFRQIMTCKCRSQRKTWLSGKPPAHCGSFHYAWRRSFSTTGMCWQYPSEGKCLVIAGCGCCQVAIVLTYHPYAQTYRHDPYHSTHHRTHRRAHSVDRSYGLRDRWRGGGVGTRCGSGAEAHRSSARAMSADAPVVSDPTTPHRTGFAPVVDDSHDDSTTAVRTGVFLVAGR